MRSAIVTLAGVLERHRGLLRANLLTKDEAALFEIANKFDLRHRKPEQQCDYDSAFLEWIFYWYLATINLVTRVLAVKDTTAPAAAPVTRAAEPF